MQNRHTSIHPTVSSASVLLTLLIVPLLMLGSCTKGKQEVAYVLGERLILPLNRQWQFVLPKNKQLADLAADRWKTVNLPHTWNNKDGQDGGNDYYRGSGVYRRTLTLDSRFTNRKLYLHFDGAAITTKVLVNGELAGLHKGSYGAFRVDVSALLKPEQSNTIELVVSNEADPDIAPLSADFTFYGGLYRNVRLIATNSVHFDTMNYASNGVFWTQRAISPDRAQLIVKTKVLNESKAAKTVRVVAQLHDKDGGLVASNSSQLKLGVGETLPVEMSVDFENPHLWRGRKDPYLYQASVKLIEHETVLDRVTDAIGLRFFHVDKDQGFFLNGQAYPLYGINSMPDRPNKGSAISQHDHEQDLALMLELGATSIRLGHQPRDPYIYQRADETGLLVWAEIPLINRISSSEHFANNIKQQAMELVRQNYNRSSIVFWGLYNEITLKQGPDPRPLVSELNTLVKQEDPSRLTTAAVAAEGGVEDSLVSTPDLVAYNRYDGWYYGGFSDFSNFLDDKRERARDLKVGIGEYGAGASESIQTSKPVMQDHSEQYQTLFHESYWETLSQRPYVWGKYIWVLADFAVDNRDEGATPGRNDKGLLSFDRRIKKDAFYWYKANWSAEPVLHIAGRRHIERNQADVDVKIFSNQNELELFVNEQSQGRQSKGEFPRFIWPGVSLLMGENKLEVVAESNGTRISDEIRLTRINSNDTDLTSPVLGVDSEQGKIYNPPVNTTLNTLRSLLELPSGSTLERTNAPSRAELQIGDNVRVIAQDGKTSQIYTLSKAPISVAKPVSASDEIANPLSIGPFDVPVMSASKANDGLLIDKAGSLAEVNLWNTMGGKNHWWKLDLGTNYYLHSIEIVWPQHSAMLRPGVMSYSIEVAQEFKQTFEQFTESYVEVVNARENTRIGTTVDEMDTQARFVRIRLHKSTIFADAPMVGDYPVFGAEEITVIGGLVSSQDLAIDYQRQTITIPAGISIAELLEKLEAADGSQLSFQNAAGEAVSDYSAAAERVSLIASNRTTSISERYTLR